MSVHLNHTIVPATDKRSSADFITGILDIAAAKPWGPFLVVQLGNDVSIDYVDVGEVRDQHHYAFLVDEADFDAAFERVQASGAAFYADPFRSQPGEINHHYGGRGVYFDDPDGHLMEIITQPYGEIPEG